MRATGKTTKCMAMANINGPTAESIRDSTKTIKNMEKANFMTQVERYSRANGLRVIEMEEAKSGVEMAPFVRAYGKTIKGSNGSTMPNNRKSQVKK